MKRILLMASIAGLLMAATMDLQARHRRYYQPRQLRGGITLGLYLPAPAPSRYSPYNSYGRYDYRAERHVAKEIRRNEKRIWKLEKKIARLYRYGGSHWEIRQLQQEIYFLARRNELLRHRRY